jgi:hypothetical protein
MSEPLHSSASFILLVPLHTTVVHPAHRCPRCPRARSNFSLRNSLLRLRPIVRSPAHNPPSSSFFHPFIYVYTATYRKRWCVCTIPLVTLTGKPYILATLGSNALQSRLAVFASGIYDTGLRAILSFCTTATDKHTENGGDSKFLYAVSEMQGWRISTYSFVFTLSPCVPVTPQQIFSHHRLILAACMRIRDG